MNYNEYNNQSNKKGSNIGILICLVIIIALCGYIAYDKGLFGSSNNETNTVNKNELSNEKEGKEEQSTEEPSKEVEESSKESYRPSFDLSKCLTCDSNYNYHLASNSGDLAHVQLDDNDHKKVTVTIYYDAIKNTGNEVKTTGSKEYTITFTKNVTDIVYSNYGLDITFGTILYLLEDGTVEYTPVLDAAMKGQIKSYGQVSGLTNIVKFYLNASATSKGEVGAFDTTLAQSSDGTLYDVMTTLTKTNNYSYSG